MNISAKRRVFYRFYYTRDTWYVTQVYDMGILDKDRPALDYQYRQLRRGETRPSSDGLIRKLGVVSYKATLICIKQRACLQGY